MADRNERRFSVWLMILIMTAIAVIFMQSAHASGDRITQSNDMNNQTAGSIGGDDTLALGLSSASFGAAIAQCVATEAQSFAFGLYGHQKVKVNYWCMGSSLYQMGKYKAAAMTLCLKTDLGDLYPSEGECINDLSAAPETPVEPIEVVIEEVHQELDDLHAEELEEQQMLIADMQAKLMNLEDELNKPEPKPKVVQQQVPFLSDEKRKALRELVNEAVPE